MPVVCDDVCGLLPGRLTTMWAMRFVIFLVLLITGVLGADVQASPLGFYGKVGPFSLQERGGQTISHENLRNHVWVAAFIFTSCTAECPIMSSEMAKIQDKMKSNPRFKMVSFTVDPGHDTPSVLAAYGKKFNADPQQWWFVTGSKDTLYEVAVKQFHLPVQDNSATIHEHAHGSAHEHHQHPAATPDPFATVRPKTASSNPFLHSSKLVVVDESLNIRGYYDGTDPNAVAQLLADLPQVAAKPVSVLPTINAFLNGTSAVLLMLGYGFIRRKNIPAHRLAMISAFGTSALFLACYLYYHYSIGGGRPFPGQGGIRTVYFAILISHTILAVAIVPLILVTFNRALRERFDKHRQIARWTLPLWLYVSVTGVVIYLMLYQMY